MMEAARTSETSVDNHFTRQYISEDNSEHLQLSCDASSWCYIFGGEGLFLRFTTDFFHIGNAVESGNQLQYFSTILTSITER
jgi:hypothetical protein